MLRVSLIPPGVADVDAADVLIAAIGVIRTCAESAVRRGGAHQRPLTGRGTLGPPQSACEDRRGVGRGDLHRPSLGRCQDFVEVVSDGADDGLGLELGLVRAGEGRAFRLQASQFVPCGPNMPQG